MRFLTCAVTALAISMTPAMAGADMLSAGKPAGVHKAQGGENATAILIGVGLAVVGVSIAVLASHDHQNGGNSTPVTVINTVTP